MMDPAYATRLWRCANCGTTAMPLFDDSCPCDVYIAEWFLLTQEESDIEREKELAK